MLVAPVNPGSFLQVNFFFQYVSQLQPAAFLSVLKQIGWFNKRTAGVWNSTWAMKVLKLKPVFCPFCTPGKWKHDNGKTNHLKMYLLFKTVIFRFQGNTFLKCPPPPPNMKIWNVKPTGFGKKKTLLSTIMGILGGPWVHYWFLRVPQNPWTYHETAGCDFSMNINASPRSLVHFFWSHLVGLLSEEEWLQQNEPISFLEQSQKIAFSHSNAAHKSRLLIVAIWVGKTWFYQILR